MSGAARPGPHAQRHNQAATLSTRTSSPDTATPASPPGAPPLTNRGVGGVKWWH